MNQDYESRNSGPHTTGEDVLRHRHLKKFRHPTYPAGFDEFTEEEWARIEEVRKNLPPRTKEQEELIDGFRRCQILTSEDLNLMVY